MTLEVANGYSTSSSTRTAEAVICVTILGNDIHGADRDAIAVNAVRRRARQFVSQGRSVRAQLPAVCQQLELDETMSAFVQRVAADPERYVLGSAHRIIVP
ncbi:hypothetical protein ACH47Z_38735 [Streptomyces sp. NPDC020192]|uniref:hypothetical protein n=1 Tax=Streptomyces sp. NPDC020192 TaxID=3365066 RepID=UPI00379D6C02